MELDFPHPVTPYPKLIINAAITGMVPTKKDSPYIPVTTEEIVKETIECCRLGASMVHIHARDESEEPTYKKDAFADIIRPVRAACPDLIICVTTSGRVHNTFETRSEVLDLEGRCQT